MHEHRDRIADLQLRGNTRPLPVRVYWPSRGQSAARPAPLLVFCMVGVGAEATCRALSSGAELVVLSVSCDPVGRAGAETRDGTLVLEWAAEHAAELGADPGRLLVAGEGSGAAAAAAVALEAWEQGWPAITRLLLIDPVPISWPAEARIAPATVVTVPGHSRADLGQALRRSLAGSASDESGRSATSFFTTALKEE